MDLAAFGAASGHLDTATAGVPPESAVAAMRRAVDAWATGRIDALAHDEDVRRSRAAFATLVGCDARDVAAGAVVSPFVGLVAASLPAGARVLTAEGDFTSLLFPLLAQADRGVRVSSVPLESLPEAIGTGTDLVAVSAVQSADGRVVDLDALADAADHHGAHVLLDATQAAGWLPVDATRFAYVVAGAYKWLLAPRGTAFMAIRPERQDALRPHTAGWYSAEEPWSSCYGEPLRLAAGARRFDLSPAWACWAGTAPALEWVAATGVDALHAHDLALAGRLRAGLGLAPAATSFVMVDRAGARERLERAGVRASVRAGRVRLSCHVPATGADVERVLEALA